MEISSPNKLVITRVPMAILVLAVTLTGMASWREPAHLVEQAAMELAWMQESVSPWQTAA